jgi:hypothetical protein
MISQLEMMALRSGSQIRKKQKEVKPSGLAAGDGADNQKGLLAGDDGVRERGVRRFVGEVFFAGEEAEERAALMGDVIADGAAEHRILALEGIEDGT